MEKRIKLFVNVRNAAQAIKNAARFDALKKELEEKGLGYIDHNSCEIVYDEKDGVEISKLMDKYFLCK